MKTFKLILDEEIRIIAKDIEEAWEKLDEQIQIYPNLINDLYGLKEIKRSENGNYSGIYKY